METQNHPWTEIVRDLFLKNGKVGLIPVLLYGILVENGDIDLSEEEIQMVKRETENRMYEEAAKQGSKALKELAHLKNSNMYETVFITEFKRQAVANYFTKQNEIDNF